MKKIRGDKPIGLQIHIYIEISQGNFLCNYLYLKLAKMSCFSFYLFSFLFCKIGKQRAEQVLPRGRKVGTSGRERWQGKGVGE
jgi:hypothetical protein